MIRAVRRVGILVVSLFASSVLVFAFMAVLPGDPARVALGVNASDAAVAQLREQFGLDRPLVQQYGEWVTGLLTNDLGQSYVSKADIGPQIADRFQVTLWLVVTSMVLAALIAVPLGALSALRHRKPSGLVLSVLSQVGVAVPAFLAGILLITVFAVRLRWLPANGWTPPAVDPVQFLKQLVLPALSLGLVQGAVLTRYVRSAILDVQGEDYLRTARSKGLMPGAALRRHGFRNAAVPVVTVLGLQLATLLVGAVVVERVFVIPGLGSLLLDAVAQRDLKIVQDVVMVLVLAVLVVNVVVDLLYVAIDPRLRAGGTMTAGLPESVPESEPAREPGRDVAAVATPRHTLRLNAGLVVGGVIVALIVLMALVSFVWTPYDPTFVNATDRLQGFSGRHWFGTDKFGRDVFSQILMGSRTTLFVGVVAVGVAAVVGVPLGIFAAMSRRWVGEVVMRANDLVLAFPALLLAIMFSAVYGGSTLVAMVAIGIATVPSFARIVRSGALQVMSTEYVLAARSAGRTPLAIGWRHVLPNVGSLVIVQVSVSFAIAVLAEAALSFLGLGTPPPTPSWGRMLQEGQELLFSAPRLSVVPGIAIAVAVLGFNLLGDGLRDLLDPRLEDRR